MSRSFGLGPGCSHPPQAPAAPTSDVSSVSSGASGENNAAEPVFEAEVIGAFTK
ncbi:hypothetical protein [Labilithrix luteola]|nr:hypothetical protein [Labilithrix luteola]